MVNYTSRSSFSYCVSHFEGEEVFGSTKQPIDYPSNVDNDSHHHYRMNFSHPWVTVLIAQPNVGMQQPPCGSSACSPLVVQGGLELTENIYVDG